MGTIKGVGRIYQQTFMDTYAKVSFAKLYDRKRFHKTIQEEFYAVAFRKKLYNSLKELQKDLDEWLEEYNKRRPAQDGTNDAEVGPTPGADSTSTDSTSIRVHLGE